MGFWNKRFPYSNVHELNLDWLISKMKELSLSVTAIAERLTSGIVRTDEIQHLDDQEKLTARTNIGAAPNTSVRYDSTQVLTSEQKTTALENISAVDKRKILDGFVRYDMAQAMGDEAQRQARANIGATSLDVTSNNYVSFASEQNLSEAQKARARNNIGAGTGGGSAEGAVRYDVAQNLETAQKNQARQNIDAVSSDYVNDNFVAAYQGQTLSPEFKENARGNIAAVSYEAQTLTSEQQAQARANIGAGTGSGSGANQVHVGDSAPTDADVIEWLDTSEDVSGYDIHELLLLAHPVGSIYQSVNDVSPVNLFGGTWERLKDVFLLAAGDTYEAGATGGEATHTLTEQEMPAHTHALAYSETGDPITGGNDQFSVTQPLVTKLTSSEEYGAYYHTYPKTVGDGQPHNNMPPYIAVYTWRRTA